MKCIERGHIYDAENKHHGTQRIVFFKDLPVKGEHHDGLLSQELVRVLLDRAIELNNQVPCHENIEIINWFRHILKLYEVRAFGRTLDKSYAKTGLHIEQLPVNKNGHLFDLGT